MKTLKAVVAKYNQTSLIPVSYTHLDVYKRQDLGGPAVFLASEASDFVNGLILYVDGGILAYIGKQPQ